ncbi:Aste57867_13232 [Aphanomyces stellatus]|uniref:Aste57867_13232 protein n=1 Tax=Aphanomyces stellatus TaxID=120398 RepID=A0A485KYH0_9STRA|nr:hypothetical protein As57867_013183 [Aphanomyces stellatus]VFT90072.1 Aste57867_13232 [Aphanomyces stellatus]
MELDFPAPVFGDAPVTQDPTKTVTTTTAPPEVDDDEDDDDEDDEVISKAESEDEDVESDVEDGDEAEYDEDENEPKDEELAADDIEGGKLGDARFHPRQSPLTAFEFDYALHLCSLSYECKVSSTSTDADFVASVQTMYRTRVHDNFGIVNAKDPFMDLGDGKIRFITCTLSGIVYICITGTNTGRQKTTNLVTNGSYIVDGVPDADGPVCYVNDANDLGIISLAQKLVGVEEVQKVVLCGHSRGGSVAHVAHYHLVANTALQIDSTKITSVAFGSTPFLRSTQPLQAHASRFFTFFTPNDIVPALYSNIAGRLIDHFTPTLLETVSRWMGMDLNLLGPVVRDLSAATQQYVYYGTWIKLSTIHIERVQNPGDFFESADFPIPQTMAMLEDRHGINSAYLPFAGAPRIELPPRTLWLDSRIQTKLEHATRQLNDDAELSQDMLPVLLVRVVAMAIVTANHGDTVDILGRLFAAVHTLRAAGLTRLDNSTDAESQQAAARDMQNANFLLSKLRSINPHSHTPVKFDNVDIATKLVEVAMDLTNMLAENYVVENRFNYTRLALFGVLGVAGVAASLATSGLVTALWLSFATRLNAAIAVGFFLQFATWKTFQTSLEKAQIVSDVHQVTDKLFRETAQAYSKQLSNVATAMLLQGDTDKSLERRLSTWQVPSMHVLRSILENFQTVLQHIVTLRSMCQNVVFIVLYGEQGIGKTSFIQGINREPFESRESTECPTIFRYTPDKTRNDTLAYIVDMPGNDSLDADHVKYVTALHGIGSIGIHLLQFDETPRDYDVAASREYFNGCDSVLYCLHKVMSLDLRLQLEPAPGTEKIPPIVNHWHRELFEMGGVFFGADSKYSIMATDICGAAVTKADPNLDRVVKAYNLQCLRANGGQSRDEIVQWINEAINRIRISRG